MNEIKIEYMLMENNNVIDKEILTLEDIEQKDSNEFYYELLEENQKVIKRQCIGRKDKKGIDIYNGDIVIVENYNHHGKNPKKVMFVYYDNLTAQYCTKVEKTNCKIEDLIMENQPLCFAHSIEVIGNIYENNELLEITGN